MEATIKDVAAWAGVSVATVSRVVNGSSPVRAETETRIRSAIAALGFRPNIIGRSLKTQSTRTLGVLLPSLGNPVFAEAVSGMGEVARKEGYTLMFTATEYLPGEEAAAVSALLEYRIDGLMLTVADPRENAALDLLDGAGVPYILLYNEPSVPSRPTVTVDNAAAGGAVADAFHHLGHKRMAMIAGCFAASDRSRARKTGFVEQVRFHGLPEPAVCEVDFVQLDVEETLATMFAVRPEAPTALFCSNDLLAISVIGALGRLRLRVPEDVSVMGFDGIAVATHLHPQLATVVQPSRAMGNAACKQLLCRLRGEGAVSNVILPYEVRLSESTGKSPRPSRSIPQGGVQTLQQKDRAQ